MANLGYFQLKANPGLWQLTLDKRFGDEQKQIQPYYFVDLETQQPLNQYPIMIHRFTSGLSFIEVKCYFPH